MSKKEKKQKASRKKKVMIAVFSVLAVTVIGGIVLLCICFFAPKSDPRYVAQRGYSHKYLGNTEEAFRAAASMEFYGIETDIRKTKDGFYICNHDATVKYANGEEKEISSTEFAELTSAPLKNDKTANEVYLCTFEKYLEVCASGNKVAVIELKEDFGSEDIRQILDIVDDKYDRKSVTFISFYFDALLRIKEEDGAIDLQYLSETKNDPVFSRCREKGISIDVRQSILTKKLVKSFHDAGLAVNVWTVNKEFDRNIVRIKGIDFITSDLFDKN